MKKLLIGMLITCSLGLVACGRNPLARNNPGSEITDGATGKGVTDGATGRGFTDETNPNVSGANMPATPLNDNRNSMRELYAELKGNVEGGVTNIKAEDWNKFSTDFRGKIGDLRSTVQDDGLRSTIADIEILFNEYDRAIREKSDVAKDKVEEMKTKIENSFR